MGSSAGFGVDLLQKILFTLVSIGALQEVCSSHLKVA